MFWSRHNKVSRNEVCTCGSGLKFKKCCGILPENERTHAAVLLTERNLELIAIAADIFGLNRGVEWHTLRETITDDQVKEFYTQYVRLWPINNTDVFAALPAPTVKLRGLYIGSMKPEEILRNVIRYSLYTDELVVVNPLHHPHSMRPDFSPIVSPAQYKQDTLEVLYLLMSLLPWIQQGIVHLVPSPIDFDSALRHQIWSSAEKRYGENFSLSPDEELQAEIEGKEMLLRTMTRGTPEQRASMYRKFKPDITDDELVSMMKYLDNELERHSLWLKQPLPEGGELLIKRMGANLEAGLMLGQATGSYLYTNQPRQWSEILTTQQSAAESEIWSPLTKSFQQLGFNFLDKVDPRFAYRIQEEGRLTNLRSYLRRLWRGLGAQTSEAQVREFSDELHEEYSKTTEEWRDIDRELRDAILSKDGLASAFWGAMAAGTPGILTGNIDWKLPVSGFCMPAINALLRSKASRTKFRNTVPLSVFIDLENKGKLIEK